MAFSGGTTIATSSKLRVSTFYGGASSLQTQLIAAIDDGDVIISANLNGRKLTVIWYAV